MGTQEILNGGDSDITSRTANTAPQTNPIRVISFSVM